MQFRAEAFNSTNTPTFSPPNTAIDTASGGRVTSTLNTPRQMQVAVKFDFQSRAFARLHEMPPRRGGRRRSRMVAQRAGGLRDCGRQALESRMATVEPNVVLVDGGTTSPGLANAFAEPLRGTSVDARPVSDMQVGQAVRAGLLKTLALGALASESEAVADGPRRGSSRST